MRKFIIILLAFLGAGFVYLSFGEIESILAPAETAINAFATRNDPARAVAGNLPLKSIRAPQILRAHPRTQSVTARQQHQQLLQSSFRDAPI